MLGFLTTLCPRCGKHRNPSEVNDLPGGAKICWHCIEHHQAALMVLAGDIPKACQECNTDIKVLAARTPGDSVPMALTLKDNIYQVLCIPCRDAYYRLRSDFFRGTAYAEKHKLFGLK